MLMRWILGHRCRLIGLAATLLLLAVTVGSLRWGASLRTPRVAVHLVPARLAVLWKDEPWTGVTRCRLAGPARYGRRYGEWEYWGSDTTMSTMFIPLWVLWGAVAAGWAVLVWRDLRRVPPGHCRGCCYDLSGLAAEAACPECGHIRAAATRPSRR